MNLVKKENKKNTIADSLQFLSTKKMRKCIKKP